MEYMDVFDIEGTNPLTKVPVEVTTADAQIHS